jgi:hypothetical protein
MRVCLGRLQKATRHAFVYSDARPITTGEILRRAYPRQNRFLHWQYKDARRAALRFATPIGRANSQGRPLLR